MDSYISFGKVVLANKLLSNIGLVDAVQHLKIPNFRGVCLRDTLPKRPNQKECGILNLDSSNGRGTHWVAWFKNKDDKYYFDSYGVQPPNEAKEKYRGVFEIQKSGDKTSSGEIGLDIRTHASPKVGQDQVSGGVSVLCWHAAPVAYVLWKPCTIR